MKKENRNKIINRYKVLKEKLKETKEELEEQKKIRENLEYIIENRIKPAKTFIVWQFYCRIRDYSLKIIKNPKKILEIISILKEKGPKGIIDKIESKQDQNPHFTKSDCFFFHPTTSLTGLVKEKVSIVIPTKNAGDDFKRNLLSIKGQKRIRELEIIIVDNYSNDKTVQIALSFGCKIIKIKNFSHSSSRNLGSKIATGDYIIFSVQDAYFAHPYAFVKLINFIKKNGLAAASGYQMPYENADIFARWQFKRHYDFMNPQRQNVIYRGASISKKFSSLSFLAKRKLINIDDVFSCFKTSIFKNYYFSEKMRFAEDAELALKLLQNRHNIGSAIFSKVYHSHNRNFIYHFKRTFADLCSLNFIFKDELQRINTDLVKNIYLIFNLMIALELNLDGNRNFWDHIESMLKEGIPTSTYKKSSFYSYFHFILEKISINTNGSFDKYYFLIFKNEIIVHWKLYSQFCKDNHYKIQKDDLLKVTAVVLAGLLGEIMNKVSNRRLKETLNSITDSV